MGAVSVTYHVTCNDWTQRRGYRDSGRGWRVRLFSLPVDDWNAMGRTISETFHRSEKSARAEAAELARLYECAAPTASR